MYLGFMNDATPLEIWPGDEVKLIGSPGRWRVVGLHLGPLIVLRSFDGTLQIIAPVSAVATIFVRRNTFS